MSNKKYLINQKKVTLYEKLYFLYRYLKIHIKYYQDLYINKKYNNVPGHKYINKSMDKKEYDKLVQELYGNKYVNCKYKEEDTQMNVKRWIAAVISQTLLADEKIKRGG